MAGSWGGMLAANDVPTIISAGVMGGLSFTGGGTAKTLTAAPASTSQDVFDTYTAEWGDDSTDTYQLAGGVINDFSLTYPQDMSAIQLTTNWLFGKLGTYPATFTGALNVDLAPVYLEGADTIIAYGAVFSVNNNLDPKRFSNGSNTRMQVQNYGRGKRVVNFTLTGAKQTAWISEASKWIAANPTERFFGIKTASTVLAQAAIPYSLDIRMPGYWLTQNQQTINTNTGFDLVAQNVYDSGLGYPFRMVSVGTRTSL
jgi:hypothetical protein